MDRYTYEYVANFPKRAVVTNGFPYGNKSLHCGHITLFIQTDFLARFLRSRLGKENVIYQSSTDCYGSASVEGYRKAVESGEFSGTIEDYVMGYHNLQQKILDSYDISLDIFSTSAFGEEKEPHERMSKYFFDNLYKNGYLRAEGTLQFFDTERNMFLNGRQVVGKCPIDGCSSEHAYADECDQGHQYMPKDLIDPVSVLSGTKPVLKPAYNWYFDLENHVDLLKDWTKYLEEHTTTRKFAIKEINEFLKKPMIYIKKEYLDDYKALVNLPQHELILDNKPSFTLVFDKLKDREHACEILESVGIRYRTGKTLVPFRITGDLDWGVPAPTVDGIEHQTFWVWPESLWAQLSITEAYLNRTGRGRELKNWWMSKDCIPYQMIGEDNIYFYGPAQHAIWFCMQGKNPTVNVKDGDLSISWIIDNKHTLFLGRKAGSSSAVKPPMGDELLKYYSAEQLRMHLLSLNVSNNNANFMPKAFNPDAKENEPDPVTREYSLLTNVFNRALRTLFYAWQNQFDGVVPVGEVDDEVVEEARTFVSNIERFMYEQRFHMVIYEYDTYIRKINKYLSKYAKDMANDLALAKQVIVNGLYICKVALVMLHPAVPKSCEEIAKKLHLSDKIWELKNVLRPIYEFVEMSGAYIPEYLPPKTDFFKIPECQRQN